MKYMDMLYKKYMATKQYKEDCTAEDFQEWLNTYKKNGAKFFDFVETLGIEYYHNIIELNTGNCDTLVNNNINGLIVTPYCESFNNSKMLNVIGGKFVVTSLGPVVIPEGSGLFNKNKVKLSKEVTYILHNPKGYEPLKKFYMLKRQNIDFCIGVFGQKDDYDYSDKIRLLDNYSSYLFGNVSTPCFSYDDGTYMYTIVNKKSK